MGFKPAHPRPRPAMIDVGLEGDWAVVTGSTRGIGRASAEALAEAGANVVVTSRSRDDARDAAGELRDEHGVEARGVAADVADPDAVEDLFEAVDDAAGGLDVLVNNAGYPWEEDRWETPLHAVPGDELEERFGEVRAVDLDGARRCTWEALRRMRDGDGGRIVYVSSTPALAGYKGTPYTEAKAGVLGLMRDVAREYGPDGVRANAVAPGNVATSYADEMEGDEREALAQEAPLRRWGEPREVADAILFLASGLSSYVTGQTLVVDGGTERR